MGTRMWFFVLMLTGFAGIAFSGCTGTLNLTQAVPKQNDPIQTVPNEWIWVSGSDVTNQVGSYGTLGTAAPVMSREREAMQLHGPIQQAISGSSAG